MRSWTDRDGRLITVWLAPRLRLDSWAGAGRAQPDQEYLSMQLSDEQFEKLAKWLESKIDHHVCQTCGSEDWEPGEIVVLDVHNPNGGLQRACATIFCANCAVVVMFDAVVTGLLPPPNPSGDSD